MKGKSAKGMSANPPRTSASPGTIRKYMVPDTNKESPGKQTGAKSKALESMPKMGTRRQIAEIEIHAANDETQDTETEDPREKQLPTKSEMAEMFARLETAINGKIDSLREDMNQTLKRVEEVETRVDQYGIELEDIRKQINEVTKTQRNIQYRLEDQENRSRRKNLRIRGLPEAQGEQEDLQAKMDTIFGGMITSPNTNGKIKFDRVHRIRKPPEIKGDVPRDVIARFHNFQDKELVKTYIKKMNQTARYGDTNLQIFADLAAETLARRRLLKPLLAQLSVHGAKYSWGFPACLNGFKEGRSATLRFPEETQKFCDRLEIPLVEIPGWWEKKGNRDPTNEQQAWLPVLKVKLR